MISEKLAGFYTKLEDKYFDVLDALDKKGIPVYAYSDFFENKGIPSFVVTIAIIVAIIAIVTLALTYQGADVGELTLSLKDSDGQSLNDVSLVIKDAKGEVLFEGSASDGETIKLNRALFNGEEISITAEVEGYQPKTIAFTVGEENNVPKLSFDPYFEGIEAAVRVIDSEGSTPVYDATVLANSRANLSYQFVSDQNGIYKKSGVPAGVDLLLKITAEGYDNYEQTVSFRAGEVREVMLTPSNNGLAAEVNIAIDVSGPDGKSIDQAKVTVYDKRNSTVLFSSYTTDGTVVAKLLSGVPLRIVVEKQGYLTYDSDVDGGGVTVRTDGLRFPVKLRLGGQKLHVTVLDSQSAFGVEGATVQLFRETGELISSQVSKVSGAEFSGIDSNLTIYVTAYRDGYLPTREKVRVSITEEVKILLNKVTSNNSTRLDIYTLDKLGKTVNGVKILIIDINGSEKVPYGIPEIETSVAGYVNATVAIGKTYSVKGYTDVLDGAIDVEVKQGEIEKKVYLKMLKKSNVLEMKFIDVFGKNVKGKSTISGLDGTILFDGPILEGSIFFDAQQKDVVEVMVTKDDGNVFTENVTVKGKDYVEVMVYSKDSAALSPTIEFIGIEDESGNVADGIIPGAFFWAKFNVTFPRSATKGGVHFRVGQDDVEFVESEKFALYDLSMQNATVDYSLSYTPLPAPGNEIVDRANKGTQGSKNKWIEGVVSQPQGTYTAKIKVRAEDFLAGKAELKFRAWAIVGSDYYRMPQDADLLSKGYSDKKAALYALTSTQSVTIYESLPECADNLCMAVNFVDEDEQFLNEKGFEAWKGKQYAIEIELSAKEQEYAQVTVTTDANIDFSSSQTTNFGFVKRGEQIGQVKKTAAAAVTIAKGGKQKVRFYFTANKVGAASINVSAIGKSTVVKDVLFNVVEEKSLLIELSENQVMAGRNFTVRVTDSGLKGVENALVKIIDSEGKTAKSILGDGTDGKGKNGYYRIQNNLGVGLYTVEVSLTGYATQALPLMIATQNVLAFKEELEAKLPVNQKSLVITEALTNESEFTVQNITIQTESENEKEKTVSKTSTSTTATDSFKVVATTTPALSKGQKQPVQITVSYLGDLTESADETTTISISGLVEGKFLTKTTAKLHMMYNKKLDPTCLEVKPSNAVLNLLGSPGSTDTTTLEITNNCETALYIAKRIRETTTGALRGMQLDADNIDLQPGETKNLTISAVNQIARGASREQSFGFELVYDSNAIKKTIPVTVKTINPVFALNYPAQITLYLAQTNVNEKATAAQPIFISNRSSFPIDNIQLAQGTDSLSQANVKLTIEPTATVSLLPGQAISPPKILFASASSRITEPVKARIDISGTMGNLENRSWQNDNYGYSNNYTNSSRSINTYSQANSRNYYNNYYGSTGQMLGSIDVTVFYSGYNCLTGHVTESFFFPSEGGEIGKLIKIVNGCAEPVTVVGVSQASQAKSQTIFGMPAVMTSIMMGVPRVSVAPGQMIQVPMTIRTAIPNIKRQNYQVVLEAISEVSQTPITSKPFPVNISSGNSTREEHVKGAPVKVKVCGSQTETEVVMPKIVENANCAEGYCDAKNAVKYIAAKVEKVIQNARSQGYSYKNTIENEVIPCQVTGICTFEELNMVPEEFDLYLQNDRITPELLEAELNKVQYEGANNTPYRETVGTTNGLVVEPKYVELSVIRGFILTGYYRRIFLDPAFTGCGYYRIAINGAFPAGPQGLDSMSPVLSINAVPQNSRSSLLTNECVSSIQNIENFNPIDTGLEPGREFGTWMTTITTDSQLKDLATQISKSRYKSEKRVASGIGNKVELKVGALTGILAQACISGNDRRTISVTIADTMLRTNDAATKTAFNTAVVKMISDALNGSFGDNCLVRSGDSYSCVNLTDLPSSIGKRQLALLNTSINFISQNGGCTTGTVYSNVPESLNFEVTPNSVKKEFIGIRRISISADDALNGPIATISKTPTGNTTVGTTTNASSTSSAQPAVSTQPPTPTQPSAPTPPAGGNTSGRTPPTQPPAPTPPTASNANLNSQLPAYSSKAIETGEMYSKTFFGATQNQSLDKPMVLKENPASSDYRYYRNIKICAEPGDSQFSGVDPQLAYIQANGVQFDVEVLNREAKENKGTSKQTITISTGTMHPDDLITAIADITSRRIEPGKPYYLTAMWEGGPDALNLEAYKNSLLKQGKLKGTSIAGDEKTDGTLDAQTKGKAAAFNKYLMNCAVSSAICNGLLGPANAVLGVLGDCGIPATLVLREDMYAAYPSSRSVGELISGAVGTIIGALNTVFETVGLGKDLIPKNLFGDEGLGRLAPQSWSEANVKTKAIVEGTIGGLGAEALRAAPLGLSRFGGALNKQSISAYSTEIGTLYEKQMQTLLESSINPALTTAEKEAMKRTAGQIAKEYGQTVSESFSKNLLDQYDAAWKRKGFPLNFESNLYATAVPDTEKAVGEALSKSKISTGEFLAKKSSTGVTNIERLFNGTSVADIKSKGLIAPASDLETIFNRQFSLDAGTFNSKIMEKFKSYGYTEGSYVTKNLTSDDLRPIVEDLIKEDLKVTDGVARKKIVDDILRKMATGSTTSTGAYTPKNYAAATETISKGTKFYSGGASPQTILSDVRSAADDVLNDYLIKSGKMADFAKTAGAELDKTIAGALSDDVSKVGKASKWKAAAQGVFTKRFAGMAATGILCGVASNAIGMNAYDSQLQTTIKEEGKRIVELPNIILEKGQTYLLKKSDKEVNGKNPYSMTKIANQSDLTTPVLGKQPERISSQPDNKDKLPEQRPLTAYPIVTNRTVAIKLATSKEGSVFMKTNVGRDTAKIQESDPFIRFSNPEFIALVFKYTGMIGFDCKQKPAASANDTVAMGAEPLAIAIGTTKAALREYTSEGVSREYNGESTWLKEKLRIALEARKSTADKIDLSVAKKVFPKANQEDLQIFVDDVAFWEKAFTQSSQESANYCP